MKRLTACWLAMVAISPVLGATNGPAENPFPPSPLIRGITFDIARIQRAAAGSDLWPITWADDGDLYTSWGDGGGFGGTDTDGRVAVGIGLVRGNPENWTGINILGGKSPLCLT